MIKFSQKQKGFTLIEVITAAFVFMVVVAAITGIFVRATYLQRRAFGAEQIQSTTLAALELISRDARVSDICPNAGVCSSSVLEMNHPIRGLIRYTYDSSEGVITRAEGGPPVDLTSSDVNYVDLTFKSDWIDVDCRQPKIVISLTAQNASGPPVQAKVQTTVVSRDLRKELTAGQVLCP